MKTTKKQPRNKVFRRIADMLKENTGRHFLDSGGAYGRNWERNQKINFDESPAFSVDIYAADNFSVSFNVYHYLTHILMVTDESEKYNRLLKKELKRNTEDYNLSIMEQFAKDHNCEDSRYSDYVNLDAVNTYNFQNVLSQTLQYCTFVTENDSLMMVLQIHGGCDVRGGYTTPQVFEITGDEYEYLRLMTDIEAYSGDMSWYSDNCGYNFYPNNNEPNFEDIVTCHNGKLYNTITGERVYFGNIYFSQDEDQNDVLPTVPKIQNWVKDNYSKVANLYAGALELMSEEIEEGAISEELVNRFVKNAIQEIEEHTLKLI